jgi:hypothetical protein
MTAKPIRIVFSHWNRRQTLLALQLARMSGRRTAAQELSQARAELVRLRAKLERAEYRYQLARSIIDRGEAMEALASCDPMETIH